MSCDFQYEAHGCIELFAKAGQLSKYSIALTSFSDVRIPGLFTRVRFGRQLVNLANPFGLASQLRRLRQHDLVFVREFLTVPLFFAATVLWKYRKNTVFVMTHNAQMAYARLRDRVALKALFALGFRFVALESDAGIRALNVTYTRGQLLTLPLAHNSAIALRESHTRATTRPVVGIVGRMRPEKNIRMLFDAIGTVGHSLGIEVEILLGCDDPAVLGEGARRGFRTVDTTTTESYDEAMRLCDVIVLNYDATRYRYRDSAVIADAVSRGIAVVCPDYPIFRTQVSVPTTVGATFESLALLPQAIGRALQLTVGDRASFATYIRYRQAGNIARIIDQWMEGPLGSVAPHISPRL